MDVTVRSDESCIRALADPWRSLWDRDATATLFQRPEYTALWLTELGADRRPHTIEVKRGDTLVGLAVMSVDGDGVLRFLGDADVTDYFGPVAELDQRSEIARALVDGMLGIDGWQTAELHGLAADMGWTEALADASKEAGLDVSEKQRDVCPRIGLSGSFDDYLASIDSKSRHEIRRKARKLEREGGPFEIRLVTGEDVHAEMETFFDMHRTSEGPKGHFLHWGMAGFFILFARTLAQLGALRLSILDLGGKPVAGVFSFAARGIWSVYNSAYDQSLRDLAPGMVLMAETIRLACEESCTTFDLLRGDEPYKYRFGARDVALSQLTLRRP